MKSLDFFKHTDAPELFAKLDYALKDGVHIQKTPSQAVFFEFIVENEDSLNDYYQQFSESFLNTEVSPLINTITSILVLNPEGMFPNNTDTSYLMNLLLPAFLFTRSFI